MGDRGGAPAQADAHHVWARPEGGCAGQAGASPQRVNPLAGVPGDPAAPMALSPSVTESTAFVSWSSRGEDLNQNRKSCYSVTPGDTVTARLGLPPCHDLGGDQGAFGCTTRRRT